MDTFYRPKDKKKTDLSGDVGESNRESVLEKYVIEADIRVDGDERYFVYALANGTRELVTVTGSGMAAERDVDALRAGQVLTYDRRRSEARVKEAV